MNRNSNTYTILYAAVLVVLVAAALAFTSISLKEPQEANKKVEKMQNILASFGKGDVPKGADKNSFVEKEYEKYIVDSYAVGVDGSKKGGHNAFDIDLKAQQKLPSKERVLPVFVANEGGKVIYILTLQGAGLWGPIWGYIAIAEDGSTVAGAVFDHKGETPGLGAEISTAVFTEQFVGKQVFNGDAFTSVAVIKPGSVATTPHNVDGISGGTITSQGVSTMLADCLGDYKSFLLKQRSPIVEPAQPSTDSLMVDSAMNMVVEELPEEQQVAEPQQ